MTKPDPAAAEDFQPPTHDALLAEAMAVVRSYDEVLSKVFSDYTADASLLSPYATSQEVDSARAFQDRLESSGRRLVGSAQYSNEQVQELAPDRNLLSVLVCSDISGVRVLDAGGADVTPSDRTDMDSMRISFELNSAGMKVKENVVWQGSSVC